MNPWRCTIFLALLAGCLYPFTARSQIDPFKRSLVQFGYNGALEGHSPLSAYAFYYSNEPDFLRTNLTLRLAISPTYLDSELGISHAVTEHTDLGIGVAGGGFADSYYEIDRGKYIPGESFNGYGAETSTSLYHLFNPDQRIPLNGLLRGGMHFSTYEPTDKTYTGFRMPRQRENFFVRTGLRWGGREPVLFPDLAMQISGWYEGQFRIGSGTYGFDDLTVEPQSHLFWSEAFLAYTLPKCKHVLAVELSAGTSLDADRFSAYRLGSLLPFVSEFPLSLPGYYYQELSAKQYALFSGTYAVPLDPKQIWNLTATASTAWVNYLPGLEQPGNWHSGAGVGILYRTPSWKIMGGYAYGFNAIRSEGRGAQSLWILVQFDLERARTAGFTPATPGAWRGLKNAFNFLGL